DNGPTPSKQVRLSTSPLNGGVAVTDKPPTPPSWPPRSPVPERPSLDDISKLSPLEALQMLKTIPEDANMKEDERDEILTRRAAIIARIPQFWKRAIEACEMDYVGLVDEQEKDGMRSLVESERNPDGDKPADRKGKGAKPALKDCNEKGPETTKDLDFVPSGMIEVCGSSSMLRVNSRLFFNAAEKLEVIPKDSKFDDEAPQAWKTWGCNCKPIPLATKKVDSNETLQGCNPNPIATQKVDSWEDCNPDQLAANNVDCCETPQDSNPDPLAANNVGYFETPHGIWLSKHVRHKNRPMRARTIADNAETEYWTKNNGSAATIAKDLKQILKATSTKPVCVIVCEQAAHTEYMAFSTGLSSTRKEAQDYATAKDLPLPPTAGVKKFSFDVLLKLKAQMKPEKDVRLVGCFQNEEEETNTDCWRECYKAVGDVLDGNYVWNRELDNVSRLFNIKAKKEI
ncbi:hypothetical protein Ocin01_14350, partial [Orchesella cincta]